MKFAKYLAEHRVAEWSAHYVRYKRLKKVLAAIACTVEQQHQQQQVNPHNNAAKTSPPSFTRFFQQLKQRRLASSSSFASSSFSSLNTISSEGAVATPASLSQSRHQIDVIPLPSLNVDDYKQADPNSIVEEFESGFVRGEVYIAKLHSKQRPFSGPFTASLFTSLTSSSSSSSSAPSSGSSSSSSSSSSSPVSSGVMSVVSAAENDGTQVVQLDRCHELELCKLLRQLIPETTLAYPFELAFFRIFCEDMFTVNTFFKSEEAWLQQRFDDALRELAENNNHSTTNKSSRRLSVGNHISMPVSSSSPSSSSSSSTTTNNNSNDNRNESNSSNTSTNQSHHRHSKLRMSELEKSMRELYRGLHLLNNYKSLNFTAFTKILKKHDKMSTLGFTSFFMTRIADSYFLQSQQIPHLIKLVEDSYARYFFGGNRKDGMSQLRSMIQHHGGVGGEVGGVSVSSDGRRGVRIMEHGDSLDRTNLSWLTFGVGLMLGISVCLVLLLIALLVYTSVNQLDPHNLIMTVFPLFRGFALVTFHIWMWGLDVFAFTYFRVNYTLVLGIDERTRLSHSHIFNLAATLTFLLLIEFNVFVYLVAVQQTNWLGWVHFPIFVIFVGCLLWPFRHGYRETRNYLLRSLRNIIMSPFSSVRLCDNYIGDQLCSLVLVMNDLGFIFCFYFTGEFLHAADGVSECTNAMSVQMKSPWPWLLSFAPYWWRLLQCARLIYDTHGKVAKHRWNLIKYAASLATTMLSLLVSLYPNSTALLVLWILCAIVSTIYSAWWDVRMDWGFLEEEVNHRYVRTHLMLPSIWHYYGACALDVVLRGFWVFTISPSTFKLTINKDFLRLCLSIFEQARRAVWNYFRVENEHITNVENGRAIDLDVLLLLSPAPSSNSNAKLNNNNNEKKENDNALLQHAPSHSPSSQAPMQITSLSQQQQLIQLNSQYASTSHLFSEQPFTSSPPSQYQQQQDTTFLVSSSANEKTSLSQVQAAVSLSLNELNVNASSSSSSSSSSCSPPPLQQLTPPSPVAADHVIFHTDDDVSMATNTHFHSFHFHSQDDDDKKTFAPFSSSSSSLSSSSSSAATTLAMTQSSQEIGEQDCVEIFE